MDEKPTVTTVVLDPTTARLLYELARLRSQRLGGRPSQSAVVRELIGKAAKAETGAAS